MLADFTQRGQSIFEVAYANLKYFFLQEGYKFYIDKKTVMPSFWQNRPTNNKGLEIPLIWPFFAWNLWQIFRCVSGCYINDGPHSILISVWPKFGIGRKYRLKVSVSVPNFFFPKPKLFFFNFSKNFKKFHLFLLHRGI